MLVELSPVCECVCVCVCVCVGVCVCVCVCVWVFRNGIQKVLGMDDGCHPYTP